MRRPAAKVTSPDHPVGVMAIVIQAALAIQLLAGRGTTTAIGDLLSLRAANTLVPALTLTAAMGALYAVWAVVHAADAATQRSALRVELVCKIVLSALTILYAAAISHYYWDRGGAPNIETYVWGIGIGFVWRVRQIRRDLRCNRNASAAARPAEPTPLGEPDPTEG